ncbi:MAG: tRNA pseudouridine(13) synthase TruD, partial [Gammaproteobacteria bacterium]|nr:tRNA pseudouridine(13) synthase TruD [Gammaproteobacteria bacterium]
MTVHRPQAKRHDWLSILSNWSYAHGRPVVSGRIKVVPEDFRVYEQMDIEPSGEGEHIWLRLVKCRQNTHQVARQLASFCGVAERDVGYSGQKDFFAVTEQWFSIWLPGSEHPDWDKFAMDGVNIIQSRRHHRKIKRGTHRANSFCIIIRDLSTTAGPFQELLNARMETIQRCGVPNYFGPQRFGRSADNMRQARQLLNGSKKVKNRNLRSLLLSAARSWLFNAILSERVRLGSWQSLYQGEPANLDGTGSFFSAELSAQEASRLQVLDIHPTAPLWGKVSASKPVACPELHE